MQVTAESRTALSRAKLFLKLARDCPAEQRIEFEAFLEAAIVFARASLHRLKTEHENDPKWRDWWESLRGKESIEFFRTERDWLLKEASPKIGQQVFAPRIGNPVVAIVPTLAADFYFFKDPKQSATDTLGRLLGELEIQLTEATACFGQSA